MVEEDYREHEGDDCVCCYETPVKPYNTRPWWIFTIVSVVAIAAVRVFIYAHTGK